MQIAGIPYTHSWGTAVLAVLLYGAVVVVTFSVTQGARQELGPDAQKQRATDGTDESTFRRRQRRKIALIASITVLVGTLAVNAGTYMVTMFASTLPLENRLSISTVDVLKEFGIESGKTYTLEITTRPKQGFYLPSDQSQIIPKPGYMTIGFNNGAGDSTLEFPNTRVTLIPTSNTIATIKIDANWMRSYSYGKYIVHRGPCAITIYTAVTGCSRVMTHQTEASPKVINDGVGAFLAGDGVLSHATLELPLESYNRVMGTRNVSG